MIKSYQHNIRELCKTIIFNYIQNAPMSDTLIEKFILKLVNNISFEERAGREIVIDILEKVVEKFPIAAYQEQLELIVMGLATGLANETIFTIK